MNQEQGSSERTTGNNRRIRVETWLSRNNYTWLKGRATMEDRSMSSVLRKALQAYIQDVIRKQEAATGGNWG